ncbi:MULTISPECIES: hypothetical protein [Bradyrhizobium]|uniref:Uncharacterized protein n=1 Tax=Bradyrhizobium barranii subsp. barranii TaxID=2823807 RepID=A0A7Z0QBS4_9BRAD|nr:MULTISPECIES: hypothetical protein [Bradyrhizobium]MBR0948243.1 hypothetical protein [Bradyrhizobium liaoningense]MBR1033096.1 hypothetical protein [Bradyrhizobium liaoningense]MDI2077634.1 hypothetical protein [Bradyrhizobium sp. Mp27]UGX92449.1 hypothetical protein G6321_00043265 [Bradyrhizobium barranii subsp. barranii]
MQRYYFPIIHNGRFQPDSDGEMFGPADLAGQYGASVARDIGGDTSRNSKRVGAKAA